MKFGLWYAAVGPMAFPKPAVALARAAEKAGFESLWTGDHVILPARYESVYPYSANGRMAAEGPIPMAEPLVWAAHVSAATQEIKFGTGVLVLPQREPVPQVMRPVALSRATTLGPPGTPRLMIRRSPYSSGLVTTPKNCSSSLNSLMRSRFHSTRPVASSRQ